MAEQLSSGNVVGSREELAWRKNLTLREEVENLNWTRGLWRMSTAGEMAEFVLLWDEVHQLQLSDSPDTIRWKWTNDVSHLEIFGFMDVIKIKNKQ